MTKKRGHPKGHQPENIGKANLFNKKPARTSSAITRILFELIDQSNLSLKEAGKPGGVHLVTLANWKSGKSSPRLTDFENVAQGMGYKLALVPLDFSRAE